MRIILAIDGSPYADMAVAMLKALQLPSATQVTVLTVVQEHAFLGGISLQRLRRKSGAGLTRKAEEKASLGMLSGPVEALRAFSPQVDTEVRWGSPAEQILEVGRATEAALIVVGAKGTGASGRFPLGSVAHKVVKYSDRSVLIVRERIKRLRRVLLAADGSKHSNATAEFLLDLPLPRHATIDVVTSLESHVEALVSMPTLDIEANRRIIKELHAAEENAAREVIAKLQKQFQRKRYQTESLVLKGRPADEIIGAAKTLKPDLIALGAKGHGGVEAFLLGSVAQRVARFSDYSVLLVRPSKH